MEVLGIIPARAGSKRIAQKNLQLLGDKPLVAWAIEAAQAASCLSQLVVSSDDEEILSLARAYGDTLALKRPADLASDTSLAVDYVLHALEVLEEQGGTRFDVVCIVQPSSPLTTAADINATVKLLEQADVDTAVSVVKLDHAIHPSKLNTLDGDRLIPCYDNSPSGMAEHELPAIYIRNGSVYASRREVYESGKVIGEHCRGYVMPRERSIDINEQQDLEFARFLYEKGKNRT